MQLWRGENCYGVFAVVTNVVEHPAGKALVLWGIGGKGYIKAQDFVWDKLESYCKAKGYKWISGMSEHKGFDRLVSRLDKRFVTVKEAKHWVKELTDVCS